MISVLGEIYYIDLDGLNQTINIPIVNNDSTAEDEDSVGEQTINVVSFEIIKMMIEIIMTEREEIDENLGVHTHKNLSIPFKIAFNTLLMNQIIKKL